ncbi:MAG: AMP-binding protein [Burkholderiales bacterium]|nr:AMP-binding protein [Burkholderiales bacterium]
MLDGCTPWPDDLVRGYLAAGIWQRTTLAEALEMRAQSDGERVFVSDRDASLTYRQVDRLANRLAAELLALGLRRGDVVLMQLPNVREFVLLFFAFHKIGVVPVLCLPAHRRFEIEHFARVTGAVAHFFQQGFRGFDFAGMSSEIQLRTPTLRHRISIGRGTESGVVWAGPWLEDSARTQVIAPPCPTGRPDPFDVAFMLLSGGTTGVSKLIPRTHADYLFNARECARVLDWNADTIYVVGLPAAHNFALGAPGLVAALAVGGSVALASSTEPEEVCSTIERTRANVLPVTPASLVTLLDSPARHRYQLASLAQICVGGQRMQPELFDRLRAAFPRAEPIHAFGMAEGLTNLSRPGDPLAIRRETQGRPVSRLDEIRIVGEDGAEVDAGAVGELITRGPYTIRGYFRNPEHNRSAFTADGFYRTGDLVRMHPSGNLVVEGRKKDLVNRGGEKISAEEVENLILAHPKVQRAAVVAMPCRVMGERVCAFVVTKAGVSLTLGELNEFLLTKQIARFKLPERLEVVDSFPCTAIGKLSKQALRERVAQQLAPSATD